MFSKPYLEAGQPLSDLMLPPTALIDLMGQLGASLDRQAPTDVWAQAADYVSDHWILNTAKSSGPERQRPHSEVPASHYLGHIGLLHEIPPRQSHYPWGVMDGGMDFALGHRLAYFDTTGVGVDELAVFSGQRLRNERDDQQGKLEERAARLLIPTSPEWAKSWLRDELDKSPAAHNPWERSFATEHEVAYLRLIERYGSRLEHNDTLMRKDAASTVSAVPIAAVQAEEFKLDGATLRLLNAPAIEREINGKKLGLKDARPTTASCFREWLELTHPGTGEPILFLSHNPHIYRTWFDVMLEAHKAERDDLPIEGAGAAIPTWLSYQAVCESLARLVISLNQNRHVLAA